MKKNVVLVAGYEYHHGRTDFALVAKKRANYLLHHNSWQNNTEVVFTLFDIRRGTIEEGTVTNDSIQWNITNSSYDAIDPALHYDAEKDFIIQDTNVLSITDAYDYIQHLGATQRRSLHEFSVISHGWRKGPVLVNSYERQLYKSGGTSNLQRDPWDKDGRLKDTNTTNMPIDNWIHFINAFSATAKIWVWGCAASRLYKAVINKVLNSRGFKAKRYGTHSDTDTCTLSFSQNFATKYFVYDPLFFFRASVATTITSTQITRTFKEIKDFLIRGVVHTYAGQLAYNTGLKVYAAVPGTGADYERGGRSDRRVMVIPRSSGTYGYSFASIVSFYKTYLQLAEDPENRGYIHYDSQKLETFKSTGSVIYNSL